MSRIAFLGTGLLGAPMARRLLQRGQRLAVWNRTREKADALAAEGAVVADSPGEAVERAGCVIVMLADAAAIEATLFDPDEPALLGRTTVIQMGTIGPEESLRLLQRVKDAGGEYLEAPVLGSIPQAQDGTLQVMVGATRGQYVDWKELLGLLGSVRHVGPVGQAAALKLALNQLIGSMTACFSLSLGMVQGHHVPVDAFMEVLRGSALYAPTFDKKLDRMLSRDYSRPNFPVKHLVKDLDLVIREAISLGLDASIPRSVRDAAARAVDAGLGDADYSALNDTVSPASS